MAISCIYDYLFYCLLIPKYRIPKIPFVDLISWFYIIIGLVFCFYFFLFVMEILRTVIVVRFTICFTDSWVPHVRHLRVILVCPVLNLFNIIWYFLELWLIGNLWIVRVISFDFGICFFFDVYPIYFVYEFLNQWKYFYYINNNNTNM